MSGNQNRGARGGQRGGGGQSRGDSQGRGGGYQGSRGDFSGGRGGSDRGRGGGGRGDFRGSARGGRGNFRGSDRGRGGGGGFQQQMPYRPSPGPRETGGIHLAGVPPEAPSAKVTELEDALVKATKGQMIEGFPGRRSYGTTGKKIVLRTNFFALETTAMELYRYEIEVLPELSRPKQRRFINQLLRDDKFKNTMTATDYARIIVTTKKLDLGPSNEWKSEMVLAPTSGPTTAPDAGASAHVAQARARNTSKFRLMYTGSCSPPALIQYLRSPSPGVQYGGRDDLIQLLNIIVCKTPNNTPNVSNVPGNRFYPYHPHADAKAQDLGAGLIALRGYFASVRPATGRILVNLNVTSGAFYKPIALTDLLKEFGGRDSDEEEGFIRMLKVKALYNRPKQEPMVKVKTITGFANPQPRLKPPVVVKRCGNANEVKFKFTNANGREREISVFDYFKNHHGIILNKPHLPVLNVGSRDDPQYLPMELCTVLPGQPYRRLLSGNQTTVMLGFAARFPNQNALSIAGTQTAPGDGLKLFGLAGTPDPQDSTVRPFGFSVGTKMLTVPGRILAPPSIKYATNSVSPSSGSWNCARQKFVRGGGYESWAQLILDAGGRPALSSNPQDPNQAPQTLLNRFASDLATYGIRMGTNRGSINVPLGNLDFSSRQANNAALDGAFGKADKAGIRLLFVVLPQNDKWLYARIKSLGDTVYGIQTICAIGSKLQKPSGQGMFFGNLALKFNIKGGGINHIVENMWVKPLDNNTMVMGIDVTHPSPGSAKGAPSVACVVASVDEHLCQWPGSIRKQKGKQEMVGEKEKKLGDFVDSLEEMVTERLQRWRAVNQQRLPTKVVVYRDGVSEGQFSLVLQHELPSFEKAFTKLYGAKPKWPKVSIFIVGKRHHTRFYPTRQEDADYNAQKAKNNWNPQAGTVVDRGITGRIMHEMYLQAHQGLQGTARPGKYHMIKDDIGLEGDLIEKFTHNLCYLFNRAPKAVSICPPAYYADLLAERGRQYLFTTLQENNNAANTGSVSSGAAQEWNGSVHLRIKDSTWYI